MAIISCLSVCLILHDLIEKQNEVISNFSLTFFRLSIEFAELKILYKGRLSSCTTCRSAKHSSEFRDVKLDSCFANIVTLILGNFFLHHRK